MPLKAVYWLKDNEGCSDEIKLGSWARAASLGSGFT
jgi:hypothetical protein